MTSNNHHIRVSVIMAGGSGERFWPLSRRERPKQLLRLTSSTDTMLAEAVKRIAPVIPPEHVYIVTAKHLQRPIQAANVGVPLENVLAEPAKRNTAGCLMYAAAAMLYNYGGDGSNISMAVTTADHMIEQPERFCEAVDLALSIAESEGVLATHGVVPVRPDTGYGYIQSHKHARHSKNGLEVYDVAAFHEKPNRETAEDFIATGNYYWNSGMFFWRVDTFLSELELARPAMARATRDMAEAMKQNDKAEVHRIFENLEDISIDYALMERARQVVVVRADYPWDDVGAWPSLDRTRTRDARGNVAEGGPVLIDCEDCIVYNEAGADAMAVSVIGVEDLVVVVSKDGVLVVPKDRAQDVRHAVTKLRDAGSRHV